MRIYIGRKKLPIRLKAARVRIIRTLSLTPLIVTDDFMFLSCPPLQHSATKPFFTSKMAQHFAGKQESGGQWFGFIKILTRNSDIFCLFEFHLTEVVVCLFLIEGFIFTVVSSAFKLLVSSLQPHHLRG
jgi:hypothetical protein